MRTLAAFRSRCETPRSCRNPCVTYYTCNIHTYMHNIIGVIKQRILVAGQQHCRLCYPSKPSTAHPQQVVVETQMSDHLSVLSPTISLTTLRAGRVVLSTVERQGKARQDVPFRRRSVASTRGVSSGQSCSVSIAAHRPGYHSCTAPLQSRASPADPAAAAAVAATLQGHITFICCTKVSQFVMIHVD